MENFFKDKRLEKNITLENVTDELCYPTYVIQALEEDKFDFLPSPYNYYCAKNYAIFLGTTLPKNLALNYKSK